MQRKLGMAAMKMHPADLWLRGLWLGWAHFCAWNPLHICQLVNDCSRDTKANLLPGQRRLSSVFAKLFLWLGASLEHFYPTFSPSLRHLASNLHQGMKVLQDLPSSFLFSSCKNIYCHLGIYASKILKRITEKIGDLRCRQKRFNIYITEEDNQNPEL